MTTRSWRQETIRIELTVYPNGKAVLDGVTFDTTEEAKREARLQYPLKPGRTLLFNRVSPKGNCTFCEEELAIEVDWILYQIEKEQSLYRKLIHKAEMAFGDLLGEIAETYYEDKGGSTGFVEGAFDLTEDDYRCAMSHALDHIGAERWVDEFTPVVDMWMKDMFGEGAFS